uniref:Uncharacterized protein LOC103965579 n=1 Tax=Rhizophora mucronata TaxID=61149 RepID=A0A2P2MJZ7_RHIMU
MSWFGKPGCYFFSSNSNHFLTCLLIFTLHFSPQLPPSLFKFQNKSIEPLLALLVASSDRNFNSNFNRIFINNPQSLLFNYGIRIQE